MLVLGLGLELELESELRLGLAPKVFGRRVEPPDEGFDRVPRLMRCISGRLELGLEVKLELELELELEL